MYLYVENYFLKRRAMRFYAGQGKKIVHKLKLQLQ